MKIITHGKSRPVAFRCDCGCEFEARRTEYVYGENGLWCYCPECGHVALESAEVNAAVLTNGDRIRSMTDEELSKFLCELMPADACFMLCPAYEVCAKNGPLRKQIGMQEWLQQMEVQEQ